jgi:predicted molibdopterin-dependent oxidoreductase YjgC
VSDQGVSEQFEVIVDGVRVTAYVGDTIASVLVRDGLSSWRRTRGHQRPRGLFCGIGACHDCLVTLDGVEGVRACLAPATADAVVRTEASDG